MANQASASERIDAIIAILGDWRGATLARVRQLILDALPGIVEEVKWVKPSNPAGVPTWSYGGIICTAEVYREKVKLTFAKGASLPDPAGLFNASLAGGTRRVIDLAEGAALDAVAFQELIRAAATLNMAGRGPAPDPVTPAGTPRMLAGGNPQIPKGDGPAPVRAYIAALSGWKREVVEGLDALIERTVPGVRRAVRWNSPFYGVEGNGWFCNVHCLTKAVKVTFFRGAELEPEPPGRGKDPDARWVNIPEGGFDAAQLEAWVRQAAARPGWDGF